MNVQPRSLSPGPYGVENETYQSTNFVIVKIHETASILSPIFGAVTLFVSVDEFIRKSICIVCIVSATSPFL